MCPIPAQHWITHFAPMGPGILSSTGAEVWRKAPGAFPDSNSVLDKFQSATFAFFSHTENSGQIGKSPAS